ncbi:TIGR04222 domain-containing membrane protein [Streptomyces sp. NPDC101118]|uniref:TIGR04222 domain-containing membrane protein n=1 Tax=Streptomyces sp. NPDC101118 TaxID=3366109 RepID=UPI003828D94F
MDAFVFTYVLSAGFTFWFGGLRIRYRRRWLRQESAPPAGTRPAPLTLREVAYVHGGLRRVVETGMAALLLSGRLTLTGRHGILIAPGPRPGDAVEAAVVKAYGNGGGTGRDARHVRDAAARAESLRWVGGRMRRDGLTRPGYVPLPGERRAHWALQAFAALWGAAWFGVAVAEDGAPGVAVGAVAAVLAVGVFVDRLTTPRRAPSPVDPTPRGSRLLDALDEDGAWVRATRAGRDLSPQDARTLATVARQGLHALPATSDLARAVGTPTRAPREAV